MEDKELQELENHFTASYCWRCNYCGELVATDHSDMEAHLESCECYDGDSNESTTN